jgi:hypothetical protein
MLSKFGKQILIFRQIAISFSSYTFYIQHSLLSQEELTE